MKPASQPFVNGVLIRNPARLTAGTDANVSEAYGAKAD